MKKTLGQLLENIQGVDGPPDSSISSFAVSKLESDIKTIEYFLNEVKSQIETSIKINNQTPVILVDENANEDTYRVLRQYSASARMLLALSAANHPHHFQWKLFEKWAMQNELQANIRYSDINDKNHFSIRVTVIPAKALSPAQQLYEERTEVLEFFNRIKQDISEALLSGGSLPNIRIGKGWPFASPKGLINSGSWNSQRHIPLAAKTHPYHNEWVALKEWISSVGFNLSMEHTNNGYVSSYLQ